MKWLPITQLMLISLLISNVTATIYVPSTAYFHSNTGWLNFNTAQTFDSVSRQNDYWYFNGKGAKLYLANITITNWLTSNWINYTTTGTGWQYFYYFNLPSEVWMDGYQKDLGDGWQFLDNRVIITGALDNVSISFNAVPEPPPPPPYPDEPFIASATTGYVYTANNFNLLFYQNQALALQTDVDKKLTIEVLTGLLNGTTGTVMLDSGGGYLTFIALNDSTVTIDYEGFSTAKFIKNGAEPLPIRRDGSQFTILQDDVILIQIDQVLAEYVPFMFILGMIGLVSLMGSPIYGIYAIRKRDRNQIVTALIMGCLGFGLFIGWLWGV